MKLNKVNKINRHLNKSLEKVTIQEFLQKKNLFEGNNICYPDPPDCVVTKINGQNLWIEETCIFNKWTKQISTNHYEYKCSKNDNDYQSEVIQKIIVNINKKNSKKNYEEYTKKYGVSILLLRIDDPCFRWQIDLNKIINHNNYKNVNCGYFRAIYLYNGPLIMEQKYSDPIAWESKVLPNHQNFFLLCGQDISLEQK